MPGKSGTGVPHGGRNSVGGKGVAKHVGTRGTAHRRHRKIVKETIKGITKGDIKRLARRGGVKRISATIYDEARAALKDHLTTILRDCTIFLEASKVERKTITVSDVIFALKRIGRPIYGFGSGYTMSGGRVGQKRKGGRGGNIQENIAAKRRREEQAAQDDSE